jgi:hypothetical protein
VKTITQLRDGWKLHDFGEPEFPEVGSIAKIVIEQPKNEDPELPVAEGFWVLVRSKDADGFIGEVNNNLVATVLHGVRCGDLIRLSATNVKEVAASRLRRKASRSRCSQRPI